ncbi:MAG TPA: hypothetical protein PKI86_02860 [Chitinophagales bacterium]|nr:hypothetical protein [Chitinophagales bacterium]
MFGLFKSKKKEIITKDFIYKNEAVKYKSMLQHLKDQEKSVLIYYFEDTKNAIQEVLNTAPINYSTDVNSFVTKVWLINANTILNKSDIGNRTVFFAEHHPSFSRENEIKQHLLEIEGIKEVIFYTSFEDKLLQLFGSERILQLMEKMGFKDDEVIEHTMISTSIERAQKRIDEKLSIHNNNTRQRKDWFEINLPAIENF